jgi:radical SAM protein with 4Fe4S-binding SPASM domain
MYIALVKGNFVKRTPDSFLLSYIVKGSRLAVKINESAYEILKLCDGTKTIKEIYDILQKKYKEQMAVVKSNVELLLVPLLEAGVVEKIVNIEKREIAKGSSSVYLPDSISWELTDACPLRCRHCYLDKKDTMLLKEEEIDRLINMFKCMGIQTIQLTGGEIFTYPFLTQVVDKLIGLRPNIILSTSGYILNDTVIEILRKIKSINGGVRVSIDGLENTHNKIRMKKDAYTKSIEFIKMVVSLGITCQVATTLSEQTREEVEELVKIVKDLGVSLHVISMVSIQGNAAKNKMKSLYDQETLKEFLLKLNDKYADDYYKIQLPIKTDEKNCGAGYKLIRIRPNLDITPCPMNEHVIGNLCNNEMSNVMIKRGKLYQKIESPNEKTCRQCSKKNICMKCMANALENKETVKNCYWYEENKEYLEI